MFRSVERVHRLLAAGSQGDFFAGEQTFYFCFQSKTQFAEAIRDGEFKGGFTVGRELEIWRDDIGADAIDAVGGDGQGHVLEQRDIHRCAVHCEGGADGERGLASADEGLMGDVEAGGQGVALAFQGDGFELRKTGAIGEDDGLVAGLVGKGEENFPAFIGNEFLRGDECGGLGKGFERLIENQEGSAGAAGTGEIVEVALADQGAAGFSIANEIHHPDTAFSGELGKFEIALHPQDGSFRVIEFLQHIGQQAIEIQVGADLLGVGPVVIESVDLEKADAEMRHIFHPDIHADLAGGVDSRRVGGVEIEINPLAQLLHGSRGQHGKPFLGIALAGGEFGFGQDGLEVIIFQIRGERFGVRGSGQECQQVIADEGFLIANGGTARHGAEVGIEIDGIFEDGLIAAVFLTHMRKHAREFEVGQKAFGIALAKFLIVAESLVEHAGLERIEDRTEVLDESPGVVKPGFAGGGIALQIDIRIGAEPAQPAMHKDRIGHEFGPGFGHFGKLTGEQLSVDGVFAEALGLLGGEVIEQQFDEARSIGPLHAGEQLAALGFGERRGLVEQVGDAGIVEFEDLIGIAQCQFDEDLLGDERLVNGDGQVGLGIQRLLRVGEIGLQHILQVFQGGLRILFVSQQRLAMLDLAEQR